jgi:hypothetical protein
MPAAAADSAALPSREKVVISVKGSAPAVERVVFELHRLGFAEVREWCEPQPTGKVNEVIQILTRYVIRALGG